MALGDCAVGEVDLGVDPRLPTMRVIGSQDISTSVAWAADTGMRLTTGPSFGRVWVSAELSRPSASPAPG